MNDLTRYDNSNRPHPILFSEQLLQLPPLGDEGLSLYNKPPPIEVPPILLPPAHDEQHYLFVGGYYLPLSKAEGHTLLVGTTGSGKSKLTYPAIGHACATLKPNKGLVVIFDTKGDMYPMAHYFAKKQKVPLHYFNITDDRSVAWDIAGDAGQYFDILNELINILIPLGNNTDPFWVQGAQAVALACALSLNHTRGNDWGLHDLYNACLASPEKLIRFLRCNPSNEPTIERILASEASKTVAGIMMQLSVSLQPMRLAAAHQYHTPKKQWASLKTIVQGGGIVVIGQKPTSRASTTPIMRAMFKRLSDLILNLPEYVHPHSHIFIDEFAYLGPQLPGIMDLLVFTRSKMCHVYLTVQNVDQLRENYGPHGAESIASCCEFQVMLRAGSVSTAEWASRLAGQERVLQPSFSHSAGGFSHNWSFVTRERMLPDEFRTLPRASPVHGLEYVFMSSYSGVVKTHLPAERVDYLQPPVSNVAARVDKPHYKYDLPRWNPAVVPGQRMSSASRAQFINQGATELEQAIRRNVWDLLQSMTDEALYDFFAH
ncbi:type IV secretion system DNA-binding domain-containing protein [Tolypothrix sp. LEGE 11397]|uniref:type IV secretory system conjugative DNA transfer family protein n=1 Tax=Tolypothrix sp. LEGE 11397 TaxID=2777971 RepID=UPI00187F7BD2|nr:type IV secretion system DNA-binding domain-containing protein [Tolypothrix sp. LEGE 11397]MBE9082856.1 type IV secretion system DNA-binding domain-containing protein [Tolypothrix sp. LEGE 11397]